MVDHLSQCAASYQQTADTAEQWSAYLKLFDPLNRHEDPNWWAYRRICENSYHSFAERLSGPPKAVLQRMPLVMAAREEFEQAIASHRAGLRGLNFVNKGNEPDKFHLAMGTLNDTSSVITLHLGELTHGLLDQIFATVDELKRLLTDAAPARHRG